MILKNYQKGQRIHPLERITILGKPGAVLSIRDGQGYEYLREPIEAETTVPIGGALGYHTAQVENAAGQVLEKQDFLVEAQTDIIDQGGQYQDLFKMLYLTMVNRSEESTIRFQDRLYYLFVPWLRDHVHVMKGMKYFAGRLQDGIDLFRDSQRQDGMIWDNCHPRRPAFAGPDHWSVRFDYGGFFRLFDDFSAEFTRIPVENDVEYLFLEGLYYTWKATGDDAWMAASLPAAKKALDYSLTSPYRWSEKFGLLKRGHTIDTWDFQNEADCLTDIVGWPDPMAILPEKTRFGIMFGDNTGYATGCRYLAEMLEHLDRLDEAQVYRQRAAQISERLNQVSWNGRFFTHHIPEDPSYQRDLGVDETTQISLSNAYSLNRGIRHDQAAAIIRTYQELKANLPPGSPGEWYTIYPPFPTGYGGHNDVWQYMNASVTPIVAGELAHGAFQHGFEAYGVDILQRLSVLGQEYGGVFHSCYTGAFPPSPERTFNSLDLAAYANTLLPAGLADELDHTPLPADPSGLAGIPFTVNRDRRAVGTGRLEGLPQELDIPLRAKATALYLLHTLNRIETGALAGKITLRYTDGTHVSQYIYNGKEILPWSHWEYQEAGSQARAIWRHPHPQHLNMQLVVYGFNNPFPNREIESVQLQAAENGAIWYVLGLTLSDQRVYFRPGPISYGIPDNWGAAAVMYALVEGLAGVVDNGVTFSQVDLAPRWTAAGVNQAMVTIRYPASTGYATYHYLHIPAEKMIRLLVTGSCSLGIFHVLLPADAQAPTAVQINGRTAEMSFERVEASLYVNFQVPLQAVSRIEVRYE